jgi:two-component system, NarL family, nitrate/nitrite response regulator NarL
MIELRILIVANDPLIRAGLATLLGEQAGCQVVGQTNSSDDLTAVMAAYQPDVLLWDAGWEPLATLARLAEMEELPLPTVILLADEESVAPAWAGGAHALLFHDSGVEQIVAALTAVSLGLTVFDPAVANMLLTTSNQTPPPLREALTGREHEVLQLLAEGLTNKAIAQTLSISDHTVKFHINAIFTKLGAQSRTEAVVRASRLGLILL